MDRHKHRSRTGKSDKTTEGWDRATALDQLRRMATGDDVLSERKMHMTAAPTGLHLIVYCRQEGAEIIAEMTEDGGVIHVDDVEITPLLNRASAGDTSAAKELQRKFKPQQLSALADVAAALTQASGL